MQRPTNDQTMCPHLLLLADVGFFSRSGTQLNNDQNVRCPILRAFRRVGVVCSTTHNGAISQPAQRA